MIKKIAVTNYLSESIEIDLTKPEESGFIVTSIDGLGPVEADINTTDMASADGSLFNSSRRGERNIVLNLRFYQTSSETVEDLRQKTYKYFPEKQELTFKVYTDNRTLKATGYTESNEPEIFSNESGCSISIICPDPNFYSAGENEYTTTVFSGVQANFQFPFSNESLTEPLIEFGIILNKSENLITYTGDSEIGITITIHAVGEAQTITIYNASTRERMAIDTDKLESLTGSGIVAGDTITICTCRGKKSITLRRDGVVTNILNCMTRGGDWFTLAKGYNIFAYAAEYGSSNLQFSIRNETAYSGV